jgi:DNA-binding CsgD family transcriptional regulator/tetratricopeptide (TPR) repeat protein
LATLRGESNAHASFVGRQAELRQLKVAFEAASSGRGALMLLVGEPGIGKTALCDQLGGFVAASGGVPLVGHCYEAGSFRRPYQPFVEAFGTYARESDTEALAADLGSGAADLARIVPEVSDRLKVPPRGPGDAEEDRWRLMSAATRLLRSAAAHQPLLLVLEDLHDADRDTLDLLLHVARDLHGARLLVVGTYRDVEVDRAHPLSAALAELHRASHVARVHLRGLSTDEVRRLLAEASQQTIAQPFAELVHRQTDGNPLFVHQTLRFVIEEGLVERRDGALQRVGEESLAGRIPEGLRDAVGKRLSRLSEGTNRVLSVAAVIGREFELDVLRKVLARPEQDLETALEEASAVGIVEERSVVGTTIIYRFSHAFFRQTLYDEIVAPRRIRVHQQVARALEEVHARRLEEHSAELAEHYSFSSDAADLAKAVRYGEVAARRASAVFAYGEAVRQLERALVVQDLVDPDDREKLCDLLLALGEALFPAGGRERVIAHVAPDAFKLAGALGDRSRAFRASRLAVDCIGAGFNGAQPEYLTWAERADLYAGDSIERVYAALALANARHTRGQFGQAHALRIEALTLARNHADTEALFSSAFELLRDSAPKHWDERMRLSEECAGWPREGVSGHTLGQALWRCGAIQLAQGERARAEELWKELQELAERTHVANVSLFAARCPVVLATVDGHLEEALGHVRRYIARADELGHPLGGRQVGVQLMIAPALHLGSAEALLAALDEPGGPASLTRPGRPAGFYYMSASARAMCLAQLGRMDEAQTLVGPLLDDVESTIDDDFPLAVLALLVQAAVVLEHRTAAKALAARLACVGHLVTGDVFSTCVARNLGDAAALAGDRAAARANYMQALEMAGKILFRPELALTHLRLAELRIEEMDDTAQMESLEHLDIAIPELRDMRMQPSLERGLTLMQQLEHQAPATAVSSADVSQVLTGREREVARLVAAGRSNREIADSLVITEGTVEVHVKHILSKLGFRSRSQVAVWAADQQI